MINKIKYFIWGCNQVLSISKAFILVEPKILILKNFSKLLNQDCDIQVTFDKKIRFIMRDFYDLLSFYEIFINKSYEKLFLGWNSKPVTFLDIGAYNGDSSIYAAKYKYVKKIYSIEPQVSNYEVTKRNCEINGVRSTVLNMAIANTKKVTLYNYKNRRQTGASANGIKRKKFIISAMSIKKLLGKTKGKVFVKCDTEGAEFDIFLNTPISSLKKIDRLIIEYHLQDRLNDLIDCVRRSGMTVGVVNNRFIDGFGYIYAYR